MQHYVNPNEVTVSFTTARSSKKLREILERDGQIVPILVHNVDGHFSCANREGADRVLALRELGWETILIEDKWTKEDLW